MISAFFFVAVAAAPPPPPPLGTSPPTISDLVRIEGACSLSVLTVGDDGLSLQFNHAVKKVAAMQEIDFCARSFGNYVISTVTNVRPTKNGFRYDVRLYSARDFVEHFESQDAEMLAAIQDECAAEPFACADDAVSKLLNGLGTL